MIRVCFVCLGNICRSPTAEGIFSDLVSEAGLAESISVDSAGTAAYHVGEPADRRARQTAAARGVTLSSRAAHFSVSDFDRFDYVVAMDVGNYGDLQRLARSPADSAKLSMLRSFDPESPSNAEVPDPYYGGPRGFDDVFDICRAGCAGLLRSIREKHAL